MDPHRAASQDFLPPETYRSCSALTCAQRGVSGTANRSTLRHIAYNVPVQDSLSLFTNARQIVCPNSCALAILHRYVPFSTLVVEFDELASFAHGIPLAMYVVAGGATTSTTTPALGGTFLVLTIRTADRIRAVRLFQSPTARPWIPADAPRRTRGSPFP